MNLLDDFSVKEDEYAEAMESFEEWLREIDSSDEIIGLRNQTFF